MVDTILVGCETEAVGTNYDARVEHATRTDLASLVDLDARVNDSSLADGDPVANVSLGIDFGAVSHFRLVAYVGEGSYVDILADRGVGADERRLLNSDLLRLQLLVEREEFSQALVGVSHLYHGGVDGLRGVEVGVHNDDRGFR